MKLRRRGSRKAELAEGDTGAGLVFIQMLQIQFWKVYHAISDVV